MSSCDGMGLPEKGQGKEAQSPSAFVGRSEYKNLHFPREPVGNNSSPESI